MFVYLFVWVYIFPPIGSRSTEGVSSNVKIRWHEKRKNINPHHCHRGKLFSNILALLFRSRDRYRDKVTSRIESELVWSDNWKIGTATPARGARIFPLGMVKTVLGFCTKSCLGKSITSGGKEVVRFFTLCFFKYQQFTNPPPPTHRMTNVSSSFIITRKVTFLYLSTPRGVHTARHRDATASQNSS